MPYYNYNKHVPQATGGSVVSWEARQEHVPRELERIPPVEVVYTYIFYTYTHIHICIYIDR